MHDASWITLSGLCNGPGGRSGSDMYTKLNSDVSGSRGRYRWSISGEKGKGQGVEGRLEGGGYEERDRGTVAGAGGIKPRLN